MFTVVRTWRDEEKFQEWLPPTIYAILNRTECFWLFSAHRCQKFVGKLEHAFKCVLWSCDQSIGVVFSFSFCMQSRMQLLKSGIWGLVVLLSVPCSCLIIFCLSNSCRLFPCISTCQILSLHYNLFQILPPALSLYKPFSYCRGLISILWIAWIDEWMKAGVYYVRWCKEATSSLQLHPHWYRAFMTRN